MSTFLKIPQAQGHIYIQSTKNNTIITLTDGSGKVHCRASAGLLGFKNSRKSTTYAAQAVAEYILGKALELGFAGIRLHVQGLGYGKDTCVRSFLKSKLRVIQILEQTPIAHNGCRPRKARRV